MIRLNQRKTFVSEGQARVETKSSSSALGHRNNKPPSRSDFESIASQQSSGNSGINVADMPVEIDIDPLLKDIVFSEDLEQKKLVGRLYRDIYYNDPVGGSAVDLMSNLPFSDFTLGGVQDKKILGIYQETNERLNIRTLLPEASVDYLVMGAHLSSLLFDRNAEKFIDVMPHSVDDAKLDRLPFYSQDPLITVAIPEQIKSVMSNTESPRMQKLREQLGPDVINLLQQDAVELDPISTLYIPRKAFSTSEGHSWFRRILPMYLLEKNLFRGTLVESARRQRGIMHLSLGDGDQWEPSLDDMDFMTKLFTDADADPLGAVIATRLGVSVEELRQGGDFWKITDTWDSTASFKLRAMGISESFLSGDATYSNTEAGLTVFVDMLRSYRDMLTRKMFYNKLFPLISLVNGFTVSSRGKVVKKNGLLDGDTSEILHRMQDGSKLLIPSVHWAKQLKPEGDATFMEMLSQLTAAGVPVPLRAMAAAGGFNLDELLLQQDDDLEQQKALYAYQKRLKELKKEMGVSGDGEEAMASVYASDKKLRRFAAEANAKGGRSAVLRSGGRKGILDRDYGEQSEIIGQTRTGKKKYIHNQKGANDKMNLVIAKSMASITKHKATPLTHLSSTPYMPGSGEGRM